MSENLVSLAHYNNIVAGVLEANFIEPAHDKQGFERTGVFLRLENRLKGMTIEYWYVLIVLIPTRTA